MSRVLVCGGRDYADHARIYAVLSHYHAGNPFAVVIHGAARGADPIAGEWAEWAGVPVERYPADWTIFGRAAGSMRNAQMLSQGRPNVVIAFPGGTGTADMCRQARRALVPVLDIGP
jgi:hypothetical protein